MLCHFTKYSSITTSNNQDLQIVQYNYSLHSLDYDEQREEDELSFLDMQTHPFLSLESLHPKQALFHNFLSRIQGYPSLSSSIPFQTWYSDFSWYKTSFTFNPNRCPNTSTQKHFHTFPHCFILIEPSVFNAHWNQYAELKKIMAAQKKWQKKSQRMDELIQSLKCYRMESEWW